MMLDIGKLGVRLSVIIAKLPQVFKNNVFRFRHTILLYVYGNIMQVECLFGQAIVTGLGQAIRHGEIERGPAIRGAPLVQGTEAMAKGLTLP